jgi:triphosphoribosyl-dephospho-CoA synthase
MPGSDAPLSPGQRAALACLLEASAPKPGNVHPAVAFADMAFTDFLISAVAIAPAMEQAARTSLGKTVLAAVRATRAAVGKNTNLGTVLLLAPLAMATPDEPLREGVARVLAHLTSEDAGDVYAAIRLAQPGGLGTVQEHDVQAAPPADLLVAMRLAADRDLVARQYVNNFAEVFEVVAPALREGRQRGSTWNDTIVAAQLTVMSRIPDSLIARKCGTEVARESAKRAAEVLYSGDRSQANYQANYQRALIEFDAWLRADGHRRNPGTTADLLAAGLFVVLADTPCNMTG